MNKSETTTKLTDASAVKNVANYFFQLAVILGTVTTVFVNLGQIEGKYFSREYLELYVILVQLIFAGLIWWLGEPTKHGWETQNIKTSIIGSHYYKLNRISALKLVEKIDFLKTHFSKFWGYLWISWTVFYSVMFVITLINFQIDQDYKSKGLERIQQFTNASIALELIKNTVTYLNTYFALCLFFVLVHKFDSHKSKRQRNIDFQRHLKRSFGVLIFVVVIEIVIYNVLAVGGPDSTWTYRNIWIVQNIFKLFNGIVACICFTLLISRLIGSITTRIGYRHFVLPFLFFYCSIQPLYFMVNLVFEGDTFKNFISVGVLVVALFGKYVLYISITKLFETKRILFHFLETHQLRGQIHREIRLFDAIWTSVDPADKLSRPKVPSRRSQSS